MLGACHENVILKSPTGAMASQAEGGGGCWCALSLGVTSDAAVPCNTRFSRLFAPSHTRFSLPHTLTPMAVEIITLSHPAEEQLINRKAVWPQTILGLPSADVPVPGSSPSFEHG